MRVLPAKPVLWWILLLVGIVVGLVIVTTASFVLLTNYQFTQSSTENDTILVQAVSTGEGPTGPEHTFESPAEGSKSKLGDNLPLKLSCSQVNGPFYRYTFAQNGTDIFYINDDCFLNLTTQTGGHACQLASLSPGSLEIRAQQYTDKTYKTPRAGELKRTIELTGSKLSMPANCPTPAPKPTTPQMTVTVGTPTPTGSLTPSPSKTAPTPAVLTSPTPTRAAISVTSTPSPNSTVPTPTRVAGGPQCDKSCGVCGWRDSSGLCKWEGKLPDGTSCCMKVCKAQTCTVISGSGPDTCTNDIDCGAPTSVPIAAPVQLKCDTRCGACGVSDATGGCVDMSRMNQKLRCCYSACVQQACTVVPGNSADTCAQSSDCASISTVRSVEKLPTTSGAQTIAYIVLGLGALGAGIYGIYAHRKDIS